MKYEKITLEVADEIALITLNDPATLNAASIPMAEELNHALSALSLGVVKARTLVITGAGRGFCSGANLSGGETARAMDADGRPDPGQGLAAIYNPLVCALRNLPIPIVTAVNGAAAGIGCSIALLGDLIVAGESAYFLQAFRRIGLVPDGGSTYLLPRMIGKARAMEMMLLGDKLPAKTALDWGLINRCVPDAELIPTAMGLARSLAEGPAALSLIRKLVQDSLDAGWSEQLHTERMAQKTAGKTADFAEGVTAFLQKRPAKFSGK